MINNIFFPPQFSPQLLPGRVRSQWTHLIKMVTRSCLMTGRRSGFVCWNFLYHTQRFQSADSFFVKYCFWLRSKEKLSLAGPLMLFFWCTMCVCVCVCCRLKEFKTALLEVFRSAHAQSVGMIALMESINKSCPSPFNETEVRAALARMQDDNQVMVADDIIFLI